METLWDNRYFLSGSSDGFVRFYDIYSIENDITMESIASIKVENDEKNELKMKIAKIKSI